MKWLAVCVVAVGLVVAPVAGASVLTGHSARVAIQRYLRDGRARGYSEDGWINACKRQRPRWISCSVTEMNMQPWVGYDTTYAVSAVGARGAVRLYATMFGYLGRF